MKATGIIRRIDNLGRIVLPKEIRRTLHIREGEPLEIFTDREGQIVLKKYSPIGEIGNLVQFVADSLAQVVGAVVCITDMEHVIAAAGNGRKELLEQPITKKFQEVLQKRVSYIAQAGEENYMKIVPEQRDIYKSQVVSSVVCEGEVIGSVVFLGRENRKIFDEVEQKMALWVSVFLGKQME